jgi:hypothetical protein
MSEPTPFSLSQLFSQLIGRKVTFTQTTVAAETKVKQIYGIYNVLPHDTAIVVKVDLPLLGSFGGVLVGLPDAAVKEHLAMNPMEELLRDAISEVLNIASAAITTEGRAIFTKMVDSPTYIDGAAGTLMKKPDRRSYFNVLVDGYQGGKFTIFTQFTPVLTVNV